MSRRIWGIVAVVLVVVAIGLFVLGAMNRAGGLLGADSPFHALQQTVGLTIVASLCGCAAIVATMLAVGRRR